MAGGYEFVSVVRPGSPVQIGFPDVTIPAQVESVSIDALGCAKYRVVWWNGRERKEDWFHEGQIRFQATELCAIGFKGPQK
jgi:hypothetical protein